jgi:gluconate 2-dehydrogenase alpha chain
MDISQLKKNKPVDVVIVGMGWTGGIVAQELCGKGLSILGLEKGPARDMSKDFIIPTVRDELKYDKRHELNQNLRKDTISFRNEMDQTALPMRQLGSFLPGEGVGGSGLHWNGMTFRNSLADHQLKSHLSHRYGQKALPKGMNLMDWPQKYSELEKYYHKFEDLCAVSGQAGNLNGKKVSGGNPFEAPRSKDYPNPPLEPSYANEMFSKAAQETGYNPYPMPAANSSRPFINAYGDNYGECQYCGHCELFACEANAKASPNITVMKRAHADKNFQLKTGAWVTRIVKSKDKAKIIGVIYIDLYKGETYYQPAETVFLCAWTLNNVQILLLSEIGKPYDPKTGSGVIGKNYCYQAVTGARLFFKDKELNPFMGAGALGMVIDDFNSDNFNHEGLGFLGGAFIANVSSGARPISNSQVPPGVPKYGKKWKEAVSEWYNRQTTLLIHGSNYPDQNNYLDLDPNYKNSCGDPLLRMTFNFRENDRKMIQHMIIQTKKLLKHLSPTHVAGLKELEKNYSIVPYQSTHNVGGAIMGDSRELSAVNKYCQSWDYPNLFVLGASAFPQNTGYNPTGPLGALSFYVTEAFNSKYKRKPGELM